MAIMFDLACYHTILTHLFEDVMGKAADIAERDRLIDEMPSDFGISYRKFMDSYFSNSFIRSDEKIKKTIGMLRECDLDVIFLQEIDRSVLKAIEKNFLHYRICHAEDLTECTSAILINQKSFPSLGTTSLRVENLRFFKNENQVRFKEDRNKFRVFTKQEFNQLNLNNKTVVQMVDKFIFISGHLTSRKVVKDGLGLTNAEQVEQMKLILEKLRETYPTFQIVCGFDINSYMEGG